jgi:hypothetical protein
MKKKIIYIFISVIASCLLFLNQEYSKHLEIVTGYSKNSLVQKGDSAKFYMNVIDGNKQGLLRIYNIDNTIIDSFTVDVKTQSYENNTCVYARGLGYQNATSYSTNKLAAGVYFLEKKIPFIISDFYEKSDITIIFPFLNMQTENNFGGKSLFPYNSNNEVSSDEISFERPAIIDSSIVKFTHWILNNFKQYRIKIITEFELENVNQLQTKLLVIYGNSSFWTLKARKNFDAYIQSGGNVLGISTYIMNNRYEYSSKNSMLIRNKHNEHKYSESTSIKSYWNDRSNKYPNYESIGATYEIGKNTIDLNPLKSKLIIKEPLHEIFKGISDSIEFPATVSNAIQYDINPVNNLPISIDTFGQFHSKKILAYTYRKYYSLKTLSGFFEFQKTNTSGKILLLGNSELTNQKYLRIKSNEQVIKNSIDYLLK